MKSNGLQLNSSKVIWCATSRRQLLLPASALSVDGVMVDPVTSVRDLGIYIDADLSMRTHVQRTVSCCSLYSRQLPHIKPSVQTPFNISLSTYTNINQSVLFAPQTSTFLSPLHSALTSVLVLFVRLLLSFGTQYPSQSVHLPPSTPSNAA